MTPSPMPRRRSLLPLLAALALVAALAYAGRAAAQAEATADAPVNTITVTGTVRQGTAGADTPGDLPVTLFVITGTASGMGSAEIEATADADGRFSIDDVPLAPDTRYIARTEYRERIFTSALVTGEQLAAAPELPIPVYELTQDPTVIRVRAFTMQIEPSGDGLQVLQDVVFENASDRLYTNSLFVGNAGYASVVVGLPPGAVAVAFPGNEGRYVLGEEQNVVVDTIPVAPGEDHRVKFSYFLPYDEGGAVVEEPVYYPMAGEARLRVRPPSLVVSGGGFAPDPDASLASEGYVVYTAALQLEPGDLVRFELSGSASGLSAAGGVDGTVALVVGLLIEAVLIGLLIYWYQRRKRGARPVLAPAALRDGLVREIAALDRQHEAGTLDTASYERQRGQLKTRLAALLDEEEVR